MIVRAPLLGRATLEALRADGYRKVYLKRDVAFIEKVDEAYGEVKKVEALNAPLYAYNGSVFWINDPEHALCEASELVEKVPDISIPDGYGYFTK